MPCPSVQLGWLYEAPAWFSWMQVDANVIVPADVQSLGSKMGFRPHMQSVWKFALGTTTCVHVLVVLNAQSAYWWPTCLKGGGTALRCFKLCTRPLSGVGVCVGVTPAVSCRNSTDVATDRKVWVLPVCSRTSLGINAAVQPPAAGWINSMNQRRPQRSLVLFVSCLSSLLYLIKVLIVLTVGPLNPKP